MTEGELHSWRLYAAHKMLPQRRIELYLAQIAFVIVRTMGNPSRAVQLSDYLFDPPDQAGNDDDYDAEEEAAFFDFNPRKRKEPEA